MADVQELKYHMRTHDGQLVYSIYIIIIYIAEASFGGGGLGAVPQGKSKK